MIKTTVFEQLKQAMKEKDVLAKGVLTLLKSALDSAEKEKGSSLTTRRRNCYRESRSKTENQALEGAQNANRDDLIEKEEAKLVLLKSFLPKQLSEEEIATILTDAGIVKGHEYGRCDENRQTFTYWKSRRLDYVQSREKFNIKRSA